MCASLRTSSVGRTFPLVLTCTNISTFRPSTRPAVVAFADPTHRSGVERVVADVHLGVEAAKPALEFRLAIRVGSRGVREHEEVLETLVRRGRDIGELL